MRKYWKGIGFVLVVLVGVLAITGCENGEKSDTRRNGYDYLVLVNKYSQLPDDWEKNIKLVDTKNAWKEDIQVEKEAYEQYRLFEKAVNKDLKEFNTTIQLDSTYRSVKAQQELWDEWSADPEKGIEYVRKFVAVPGYSEHHTGLAIDICLKKDGELVYDNDEMIAEKEIFAKIHARLAEYGFILRYLEDREDSTGYTYEPWHLRYVGSAKIAQEIMNGKFTLEEYLAQQTDYENVPEAAKLTIEKTLQDYFNTKLYKGKISNSRFNVTRIYTAKDAEKEEALKDKKLGSKDLAFEVTYQIQPEDEKDVEELTVTDGEYDEDLGWIKNIGRLGILRYDEKTKSYTVDQFDTGW